MDSFLLFSLNDYHGPKTMPALCGNWTVMYIPMQFATHCRRLLSLLRFYSEHFECPFVASIYLYLFKRNFPHYAAAHVSQDLLRMGTCWDVMWNLQVIKFIYWGGNCNSRLRKKLLHKLHRDVESESVCNPHSLLRLWCQFKVVTFWKSLPMNLYHQRSMSWIV